MTLTIMLFALACAWAVTVWLSYRIGWGVGFTEAALHTLTQLNKRD